jgi:uncharacterized membrane protein
MPTGRLQGSKKDEVIYNPQMPRVLPVALTAVALVWLALLLLAPFAPREAALVYQYASGVCHQKPERSFRLAGTPLPVCARCFGLYASGAAAAAAAMLARGRPGGTVPGRRAARLVLAAAALPTVVTVAAEWIGVASPSNLTRAIASLPLGAAAGWLFVRMLLAEARHLRTERGASAAK